MRFRAGSWRYIISLLAFAEAHHLVNTPDLEAFNIKEDLVSKKDSSGFSRLIDHLIDSGVFQPAQINGYWNWLAMDGTPLYYVAMVAEIRRILQPR